jgi:ribosomal protein S18 acetylase RimI-like enzyme
MSADNTGSINDINESNRQVQLLWEDFAQHYSKGEIVRYPGLTAAWCHAQWPMVNGTIVTSPIDDDQDLDRRVQTAIEHGRQRDKLWLLVCCKEWLPRGDEGKAQEILARHGLHQVMAMTGMVTDELLPCTRQPTGLVFRPVTDAETRCAVADINAVSYEIPLEWGREVFSESSAWHANMFGCLAYADGAPVSTATTIIQDGIRYMALVATQPEFRHRGYAEAAMRESLQMAYAATGIKRTVLHATAMGKPTYERMGYRSVATFNIYMLRR